MKILLWLFLLSPQGDVLDALVFNGITNMVECQQKANEAEKHFAKQGLIVKGFCVNEV